MPAVAAARPMPRGFLLREMTATATASPTLDDVGLHTRVRWVVSAGLDRAPKRARMGIIDLFAGIGCVAHGFARTGHFESIALVDIDPDAARTCRAALGDVDYLERDIACMATRELLESADGRAISGVVGCPPCQGFSAAGRRRADDPRNRLLGAYFAVIERLKPAFFVMENVPSVIYRQELAEMLRTAASDYATAGGVLNAACYGLPQTRQRAVVIGYRRDLEVAPTLPPPTHWGTSPIFLYGARRLLAPTLDLLTDVLGDSPHIGVERERRRDMRAVMPAEPSVLADFVVVEDALDGLPALLTTESGSICPAEPVSVEQLNPYAHFLATALSGGDHCDLHNHAAWGHRHDVVARMVAIPEGGRPAGPRRYHSQAYARLHRRGLARTITTNFHNAGCGRFTHPAEPRTLTVREAARLQGIPDGLELMGTLSVQERLVGNAFPPPLAEAIARHIARDLGDRLDA
jgi:DNA (cytosine-5)-methyltransferase 1